MGKKLVGLDETISAGFSYAAEDLEARMEVFEELRKLSDGRAVIYGPSMAVAQRSLQSSLCRCSGTAWGLKIGTRTPNHYVCAQATSWVSQTIELMRSDGRWRLVVYGGDVSDNAQLDRVNALGASVACK